MSLRSASGTNSLINGDRFSVRLPSRIVAICVSEPIGFECPRRILSTPAMKVVATAPRPGVRIPSVPPAGRMVVEAKTMSPRELWPRARTTTAQPEGFFGGEPEGRRVDAGVRLAIHELHPLHDRDPRRHGEKHDDGSGHPAVECEPEERLRGREQHDPLGP